MQKVQKVLVTACAAVLGTTAWAEAATAPISLLEDDRHIRANGHAGDTLDSSTLNEFSERVDATFGEPFDETLVAGTTSPQGHTSVRAVVSQDSNIQILDDGRLLQMNGSLSSFNEATGETTLAAPRAANIQSASVFDVRFQTDLPMLYELDLAWDSGNPPDSELGGQPAVQVLGLQDDLLLQLTDRDFPGLAIPSEGTLHLEWLLEPGTYRFFAEAVAAGSESEVNRGTSLTTLDFDFTGRAVPTPTALVPGLMLLGGLALKRRRSVA